MRQCLVSAVILPLQVLYPWLSLASRTVAARHPQDVGCHIQLCETHLKNLRNLSSNNLIKENWHLEP